MKYIYLILNWLFGASFLLLGLVMLFSSPIAGLSLFGCGALLMPPIRSFAFQKTNKQIPSKVRTILISVLLIGFVIVVNHEQNEERQIAAEKRAEEQATQ